VGPKQEGPTLTSRALLLTFRRSVFPTNYLVSNGYFLK
jgi:hypothetical protein